MTSARLASHVTSQDGPDGECPRAEKLCRLLADLSVSIGVATLTSMPGSLAADLVGRAGTALGEAARLGCNRIEADAAVVAASAAAAGWFDGPRRAGKAAGG